MKHKTIKTQKTDSWVLQHIINSEPYITYMAITSENQIKVMMNLYYPKCLLQYYVRKTLRNTQHKVI